MDTPIGTLRVTCNRGHSHGFHDITHARAQEILDTQFEDRSVTAFYIPEVQPMKSNYKRVAQ